MRFSLRSALRLAAVLFLCLVAAAAAVPRNRGASPLPAAPAAAVPATAPVVPDPAPATPAPATPEPQPAPATQQATPPAASPEPAALPVTKPGEHLKRVPVLMYHEIGDVENGNYVRRPEFEAQIKWLKENGYQTVSLGDLYRHLKEGKSLPLKPIVLTFDDGYETFYSVVAPLLRPYKYRATNFIITGMIGKHREHMTWAQVAELAADGFEMAAHSINHPDLRKVSGDRMRKELAGSKLELEAQIQKPVQFFAYPAGRYNDEAQQAVREAGFLAAVTTEPGPVTPDSVYTRWPRVRIQRGESIAGFADRVKRASGSEGEGH